MKIVALPPLWTISDSDLDNTSHKTTVFHDPEKASPCFCWLAIYLPVGLCALSEVWGHVSCFWLRKDARDSPKWWWRNSKPSQLNEETSSSCFLNHFLKHVHDYGHCCLFLPLLWKGSACNDCLGGAAKCGLSGDKRNPNNSKISPNVQNH